MEEKEKTKKTIKEQGKDFAAGKADFIMVASERLYLTVFRIMCGGKEYEKTICGTDGMRVRAV